MEFQIEHLPNLRVINFYLPKSFCNSALLFTKHSSAMPEFVRNIFAYADGEYCLVTSDLLAFKYINEADIENIRMLIMAELEDFLAENRDLKNITGIEDLATLVEAIANSYIRPTLNRDKGDIILLGIDGGVLKVKFSGHCAGCPFAQNTLNNVIAKAFNKFIPAIKEIRLEE